eukprot:TRINITY_DN6767_c0_g2_i1.p1 TRINITY_DN6767_c0_g2~~TRINITY_DN6767_c0_g2_i1.p1  ORF type:complete len:111 (+),score=4.86 TRINITY_DN6767_c0_g2_i1:136-468(+)
MVCVQGGKRQAEDLPPHRGGLLLLHLLRVRCAAVLRHRLHRRVLLLLLLCHVHRGVPRRGRVGLRSTAAHRTRSRCSSSRPPRCGGKSSACRFPPWTHTMHPGLARAATC